MITYDNLNKIERLIMLFSVWIGEPVSENLMSAFTQLYYIPFQKAKEAISTLLKNGILQKESSQYFYATLKISPEHYLSALTFLTRFHPQLHTDFKSIYSNAYKRSTYAPFRNYICEGNTKKNAVLPICPGLAKFFAPVLDDPEIEPYLVCISDEDLLAAIAAWLKKESYNDQRIDFQFIESLVSQRKAFSMTAKLNEYLDLYRYFENGEAPSQQQKTPWFAGLVLRAVRKANATHYDEAVTLFTQALKIFNKTADLKNVFDHELVNFYYVMSLVHDKSDENKKKLVTMLNKRAFVEDDNHRPSQYLIQHFFNPGASIRPQFPSEFCPPLVRKLLILTYYYLVGKKSIPLQVPETDILRHEMAAYLPLNEADRKQLTERFGDTPILTSIQKKENWEFILEKLIAENEAENQKITSGHSEGSSRIIYILNKDNHVTVREQKRLKSGNWSVGKVYPIENLWKMSIPCLDNTDKLIAEVVRKHYCYYSIPMNIIAPLLAKTNRVFTIENLQLPVTITETKPYLSIKQANNKFYISTNIDLSSRDTEFFINKIGVRHYSYCSLKPLLPFSELLKFEKLPLKAEPLLKQLLQAINGRIDILSDLNIEDEKQNITVDSDARVCLQLSPFKDLIHLDFLTKPIDGVDIYCKCGTGAEVIVGQKEGKPLQTHRDLKKEKEHKEWVLGELSAKGFDLNYRSDDCEMTVEETLELLEWIPQHPDICYAEWPKGVKLKLAGSIFPEQVNITFTGAQKWFEIEGDVKINEQKILQISTLLELMRTNKGRFIKLENDEYVALSDSLRKQLAKLDALATSDRNRLKITPVAVGLLDDIFDSKMQITVNKRITEMRKRIAQSENVCPPVPASLNAELRVYQQEGFEWITRLNSWGAGACLADDMGLGKTVQTIAFLLHKAHEGASLVVAPASVIPNWRNELQKFAPSLNTLILNNAAEREQMIEMAKEYDVVLTTYGLLVTEENKIISKEWNIVCLDEAHTIKNRGTKMSKSAMKLNAKGRLILTGTPIQNHLGELWNLFQFINPDYLGSYDHFHENFIVPIEAQQDREKQSQLQRMVRPFMLRRTKNEVIHDLPEKMDITIPVDLSETEMAIYESMRRSAENILATSKHVDVAVLAEITRLRQAACSPELVEKNWKGDCSKLKVLLDLIDEIKQNKHSVLVFSQFTSFLGLIRNELDQRNVAYLYLDGSTPMAQREKIVRAFQSYSCPLFLISLKAGGLGLNLTAANYVIHLDPWWNPAIEQQATDRTHRIGQRQNVTVYHLIANNTIEEKIVRLHRVKKDLADSLLDGSNMAHKLTKQELLELIGK